jgi:hypothetical protein
MQTAAYARLWFLREVGARSYIGSPFVVQNP